MKPKPFVSLNHLTVPVAIRTVLLVRLRSAGRPRALLLGARVRLPGSARQVNRTSGQPAYAPAPGSSPTGRISTSRGLAPSAGATMASPPKPSDSLAARVV